MAVRSKNSPSVVLWAVMNKARGTISSLITATGCFIYYKNPLGIEYRVKQADVSVGTSAFFCTTVSASYFTISPEPNSMLIRLKYNHVLTQISLPYALHNACDLFPGTASCAG